MIFKDHNEKGGKMQDGPTSRGRGPIQKAARKGKKAPEGVGPGYVSVTKADQTRETIPQKADQTREKVFGPATKRGLN